MQVAAAPIGAPLPVSPLARAQLLLDQIEYSVEALTAWHEFIERGRKHDA
jgi:hypothetical protein